MGKIKVAIIGFGRIGQVHFKSLINHPNYQVTHVCDIKPAADFSEKFPAIKYVNDYREILTDPAVEAVLIGTPTSLHPTMIIEAAKAKKHIFCEKPIGFEMTEIMKAYYEVKKQGVKFQLGFMRRFDASYRHAKEIIDAGGIGEIIYIRAYGIDPISGMESFTKFATDNDSGGIFVDMCIHDIDLIRWYTGSDPVQTWSIGNNIAAPELEAINEFETGVANLRFENNMAATLIGGRHAAHGNQVEMEIMGSNGWIRIAQEPEKDFVTLFTDAGVVRPAMQSFSERFTEAFITELKDFIENVKNDRQSDISVEDGVKALQIAKACKESAETGQVIDIVL